MLEEIANNLEIFDIEFIKNSIQLIIQKDNKI